LKPFVSRKDQHFWAQWYNSVFIYLFLLEWITCHPQFQNNVHIARIKYGHRKRQFKNKITKKVRWSKTWQIEMITYQIANNRSKKGPCITKRVLIEALVHVLSPMFFECIIAFITVHGCVNHNMEVMEDCTSHFNIFDFFYYT